MSEEIPAWAFDRARNLTDQEPASPFVGAAFARYISQHEQPPVDPDVAAVRDLILSWVEEPGSYLEDGILNGALDETPRFKSMLATYRYRKHKEAGK